MQQINWLCLAFFVSTIVLGCICFKLYFKGSEKDQVIDQLRQKDLISQIHLLPLQATLAVLGEIEKRYTKISDEPYAVLRLTQAMHAHVVKKYTSIEKVDVFIRLFQEDFNLKEDFSKEWKVLEFEFKKEGVIEECFIAILQKTVQKIKENNVDEAEAFLKMIDSTDIFRFFNKMEPKYKFINSLRQFEYSPD